MNYQINTAKSSARTTATRIAVALGTTVAAITIGVSALAASTGTRVSGPTDDLLKELASLAPKPIATLPAAEARLQPTMSDALRSFLAKRGVVPSDQGITQVADKMIAGAAGPIRARIYRPDIDGTLPIIVYFHGGGWVLAEPETYDSSARALAKKSSAIVVSVEYRKAPEAKFPAAHDDAFAAYQWVLANAAAIGGDAGKVAVAGESAGGNLAVNVAIRARDAGVALPVYVLAVYPVAGADLNTPSYRENADARPLNKASMQWFFNQYLNSVDQIQDPRINLVAANLKGLPPTMIITAEFDPLRSEGQLLAQEMQDQGVTVKLREARGVTHEFFGLADVEPIAALAQDAAAEAIKAAF